MSLSPMSRTTQQSTPLTVLGAVVHDIVSSAQLLLAGVGYRRLWQHTREVDSLVATNVPCCFFSNTRFHVHLCIECSLITCIRVEQVSHPVHDRMEASMQSLDILPSGALHTGVFIQQQRWGCCAGCISLCCPVPSGGDLGRCRSQGPSSCPCANSDAVTIVAWAKGPCCST